MESLVIKGPTNATVHEYEDVFMQCVLTEVSRPEPTRQWRLCGDEYTPSTLPVRFFTNGTGLIIHPAQCDDDGLTVQCFVGLFNTSTVSFVTINSSVGVVHIEGKCAHDSRTLK